MGNMGGKLFMGTKVLAGTARATVVRTGPSTQMGTIVQQVGAKNYYASSPVYRRLDEVGAGLARCGVGVTVLALLSGLMHGKAAGESLVNATGLAVSVIPRWVDAHDYTHPSPRFNPPGQKGGNYGPPHARGRYFGLH